MFFLFIDPKTMPIFSPELVRLEAILDRVRNTHPQMTVTCLFNFMYIARRIPKFWLNDKSLKEIAKEMNTPYTTATRNIDLLGEGSGQVGVGLKLIEKGYNPKNKKALKIRMLPKGRKLVRDIEKILKNPIPNESATP